MLLSLSSSPSPSLPSNKKARWLEVNEIRKIIENDPGVGNHQIIKNLVVSGRNFKAFYYIYNGNPYVV